MTPLCVGIRTGLEHQFGAPDWDEANMDLDEPFITNRALHGESPFRDPPPAETVELECGEELMIPWCVYTIMADQWVHAQFFKALAQADIATLWGTRGFGPLVIRRRVSEVPSLLVAYSVQLANWDLRIV